GFRLVQTGACFLESVSFRQDQSLMLSSRFHRTHASADVPDRAVDGILGPDTERISPLAAPPASAQSRARSNNAARCGRPAFSDCEARTTARMLARRVL